MGRWVGENFQISQPSIFYQYVTPPILIIAVKKSFFKTKQFIYNKYEVKIMNYHKSKEK